MTRARYATSKADVVEGYRIAPSLPPSLWGVPRSNALRQRFVDEGLGALEERLRPRHTAQAGCEGRALERGNL